MITAMSVNKIAISLDEELLAAIRAAAAENETSVSGWLADAAASMLRRRAGLDLLAEYESEYGEITDAEVDAIR